MITPRDVITTCAMTYLFSCIMGTTVMSIHKNFWKTSKLFSKMCHSSEYNQTELTRKIPENFISITEHVRHLAVELEIENADGLDGNEMEIIALIRNCPLLYDKSFPDYNDAKKKDQAWRAIAKVFNVSSSDLQQFWYNLKKSFLKFSSKCVDVTTNPAYFDEMQFLKDVNIETRITSCNSVIHQREDSNTSASSEPGSNNDLSDLKLDVLIERIRGNPVLYDRKHKDAKNHDLKLKTWKKLAKEIDMPVSECVNRWKILREKFGRERKYRKAHPDGRKWYLFEKLSFLEDHIFKKRYSHTQMQSRIPKVVFNSDINTLGDDFYASSKSFPSEDHLRGIELGTPMTNIEYNRMMEKLSTRQYFEKQKGTRDDIFVSTVIEDSLRDEDELFALTIAAELKKIRNGRKKMKLKADIFQLLQASTDH